MKKVMICLFMLSLCLTACGAEPSVASEPEPTPVLSAISSEHCFLCGDGAADLPYWGQNNIGVISLNTFEVMPIEINRYDAHGAWIEQHAGYVQMGGFEASRNGFSADAMVNPDSGYVIVELSLRADSKLDANQAAAYLCQPCLDNPLSEIHGDGSGVGILNFAAKELHPLETCCLGFGLGDYYIDCNWHPETSYDVRILSFYHPPRYGEDKSLTGAVSSD